MTTITGSITNANPGPTLYNLIETAALALGWTLEDTVTIGGNTHKVLKSAAAGNTYSLDWYLDINYPTTGTTGGMRFAPFEGYTAASDVGLRGPYSASNTTIDATTYSRFGASTSALETNWTNSASNTGLSATLSTSAFTYWVSITRNRIIAMTSLDATSIYFSGFFTPTSEHSSHAGAALFPLIMTKVQPSGNSNSSSTAGNVTAALTRIPKASTSFSTFGWSSSVNIQTTHLALTQGGGGVAGGAASEITGLVQIAPIPVHYGVGPSLTFPQGTCMGYLGDVRGGFVTNGTTVRGDTLTVGSDTWYATSPSTGWSLFFKGA